MGVPRRRIAGIRDEGLDLPDPVAAV